jgi:hypothetical protein
MLIEHHTKHLPAQQHVAQGSPRQETRQPLLEQALLPRSVPMVTENPERQFKQAWHLAKGDARMRARMISWLNEQLQADDMGLPG